MPIELHGHRKKLDFFIQSLERYRKMNGLKPGQLRVVEVGCSNGCNISLPLAELGYQVTGIDKHPPSIAWGEAHNSFPNVHFICQDFTTFYSDEKFDVVVLSDILEHVEDPLRIVRLSLDHLKDSGMVLVCIPNGNGPYEKEQRFLRITKLDRMIALLKDRVKHLLKKYVDKQVEYNFDSRHVQFFSMADFEDLVSTAGLRIDSRANGALFGGNVTYALGVMFPFIIKPSLWLADHLPARMVTTWYFRLSPLKRRSAEILLES